MNAKLDQEIKHVTEDIASSNKELEAMEGVTYLFLIEEKPYQNFDDVLLRLFQ